MLCIGFDKLLRRHISHVARWRSCRHGGADAPKMVKRPARLAEPGGPGLAQVAAIVTGTPHKGVARAQCVRAGACYIWESHALAGFAFIRRHSSVSSDTVYEQITCYALSCPQAAALHGRSHQHRPRADTHQLRRQSEVALKLNVMFRIGL